MIKKLDNRLIFIIILFMIISILGINSSMLFSSVDNLLLKQVLWYIVGFIIIRFRNYIPLNKKVIIFFYLINLLLLVLVLFNSPINGSKCWISIPLLGSFQPSEFMKIALILVSSLLIKDFDKKRKKTFKREIIFLLKVLLIFIPPTILTFLEPDTGAVIIYFIIAISMLLSSSLRKRWFIILLIILSTIIVYFYFNKELLIHIFGDNFIYRINRILDWKNKTSMQLENSLVAIGSSGIIGHGYLNNPIYFPESSTDFIFSIISSNFGLIGSLLVIFLIVIFNITLVNMINKKNKYLIIGTLSMLLFMQIQNIGMTLGILPIIGITLPFISYGGSSLISYFLIISLILRKKEA